MTISKRSVEIFDWYLSDLNKQYSKNGTLINNKVKALSEQAQFIVKLFRYLGKPNVKLVELRFYITKLAEVIGFDSRCLHKTIYQE